MAQRHRRRVPNLAEHLDLMNRMLGVPEIPVIRRRSRSYGRQIRQHEQEVDIPRQVIRPPRRSLSAPRFTGASGTLKELAVTDDIIKSLECPVCYSIPIPPIVYCKGGHLICSPCRSRLVACGLCKRSFSSRRNYAVEEIVNSSYFNCPYNDDGCTEVVKGQAYKRHADTCEFRNVICTETRGNVCESVKITYGRYWKHLEEIHTLHPKVMTFDERWVYNLAIPTDLTPIDKRNNSKDKCCFEILGTHHKFILRGLYSNGYFKVIIFYVGGVQEALNFKADFQIRSSSGKKPTLLWNAMDIISFRKDVELEGVEVVTVHKSYMKDMAKNVEDGIYTFGIYFKIKQIETENENGQ